MTANASDSRKEKPSSTEKEITSQCVALYWSAGPGMSGSHLSSSEGAPRCQASGDSRRIGIFRLDVRLLREVAKHRRGLSAPGAARLSAFTPQARRCWVALLGLQVLERRGRAFSPLCTPSAWLRSCPPCMEAEKMGPAAFSVHLPSSSRVSR